MKLIKGSTLDHLLAADHGDDSAGHPAKEGLAVNRTGLSVRHGDVLQGFAGAVWGRPGEGLLPGGTSTTSGR
jgi:hypothetical protein